MKNTILLLFIAFPFLLSAQGSGLRLGNDAYHIIDRLEIKTGIQAKFHTSLKYYNRSDVASYAMAIDTSLEVRLSSKDRRDLYYIFKDNNEWLGLSETPTVLGGRKQAAFKKEYVDSTETFYRMQKTSQFDASLESDYYIESKRPLLRYFYRTPANFFELNKKFFYLKLNPIINFKLAKENGENELIFFNQRGFELRGGIDDRIFFYTSVLETQAKFADYVFEERIRPDKSVPGAGFFRAYESELFNIKNGYDFATAQGHIGFNVTHHIGIQFGHGRNFIGNGYRSLMLSDYANNYLYFKINTNVWRFHLQNIFGELTTHGSEDDSGDFLLPKKYFAAHHLSINISPKITFGLFESVVFSRNNSFEFQYLNPVILYRTVEHALGSSDNLIFGMDAKWNFLKRFSLYGQFILDEFKFDELITNNKGWWANKYGAQIGLKYIDAFGVDHLDAQVEFNTVRPYTYSHRDSSAVYAHFNQALAHPLKANFKEWIFKFRYQPTKKLVFEPRIVLGTIGEDTKDLNWGNDFLLPNETRIDDFNNITGQGVQADLMIIGIDVSYQLFHNFYIDLHYFQRTKDSQDDTRDQETSYFGGGIRMNIANRNLDF